MIQFKPLGYNSLSPYFIVDNAPRFVKLMKDLFDAEELRKYEMPDGSLMHVELRLDDSVIMLSEATSDYPANEFLLHFYVHDAIAVYKKALELGCEGLQEPIQKEDPDLRGMFKDFNGNVWSIGTQTQ
ncbi:VOC family protein [Algoriphagus sp.]|uniref:VOC family protein n=1 Tax=Algoriphagus sp. TaxID=1872435 RepID=UPI00391AE46B